MTRIRIAAAAALAVALLAGGAGHSEHGGASTRTHTAALTAKPSIASPPVCCWG